MIFFPEKSLGERIICFTTSVHGGISEENYQSFNLASHVGDSRQRVDTNRALLKAMLEKFASQYDLGDSQLADIKWLTQTHSNVVKDYVDIVKGNDDPADAVVTDKVNTPIAVMSADCLPIVVFCQYSKKIAAIHAGYKGLLNNVIQNSLERFTDLENLRVWIGPSIKQHNFQISNDLLPIFSKYSALIKPDIDNDKSRVDLQGIAKQILFDHGVNQIEVSEICSYQNKDCFSHRRATHLGKSQTGRMATIILRV